MVNKCINCINYNSNTTFTRNSLTMGYCGILLLPVYNNDGGSCPVYSDTISRLNSMDDTISRLNSKDNLK